MPYSKLSIDLSPVPPGVLTLRLGKAAGWTSAVDTGFQGWVNEYLPWITTNKLAIEEQDALKYVHCLRRMRSSWLALIPRTHSNHGSFFYNQLASLYLIINDNVNAKATLEKYFDGIYMGQIDATGEQVCTSVKGDLRS